MILQSDPQWQVVRRGHCSTSRLQEALAKLKSGKPAESSISYAVELVGERACNWLVDRYVTAAMQRGLDEEPNARDAFEDATGLLVEPAAWCLHPTIEFFGSTPDGFIGKDRLLEIKVPSIPKFIRWTLDGEVPAEHLPQLIGQQAVTGRRSTHFVAWCPEAPEAKRLFMREFSATDEQIKQVEDGVQEFLERVDTMFIEFTHKAA